MKNLSAQLEPIIQLLARRIALDVFLALLESIVLVKL